MTDNPDAGVDHDGCVVHSTPRHYCEACAARGWQRVKELEQKLALSDDLIRVSDEIIDALVKDNL